MEELLQRDDLLPTEVMWLKAYIHASSVLEELKQLALEAENRGETSFNPPLELVERYKEASEAERILRYDFIRELTHE